MKKYFLSLVIISFVLFNPGCKKAPTEPNATATLSIEDVSCTEAWVKITTTNYQTPNTLTLFVNDKADQNITLVSSDTLIYVDSLLPNQSYKIKAAFVTNNQQQTTNEVIAKMMDTTNHNFNWQTFTFGGDAGSSGLSDVAIIDENNIWAVGEIYMNDSLGKPDPNNYNAAHWNGSKWELIKISGYGGWACRTVFAFSENNIWFEGTIQWDGKKYSVHNNGFPLEPNGDGWQINKLWGTSTNDLYAVGNGGNIAHYDGNSWKKIESGTNLNFYNIWGNYNLQNNIAEVISVGSVVGTFSGSVIMKTDKQNSVPISSQEITENLTSVWFESNRAYYVGASNKIFFKHKLTDPLWSTCSGITSYSKTSITGNSINDLFVSASYGDIVHFNGYSWVSYYNQTKLVQGVYGTIKLKDNTAVAVGQASSQAVIAIGKRY